MTGSNIYAGRKKTPEGTTVADTDVGHVENLQVFIKQNKTLPITRSYKEFGFPWVLTPCLCFQQPESLIYTK
jgi:hypothetical protein